jgi:hypothetical protein
MIGTGTFDGLEQARLRRLAVVSVLPGVGGLLDLLWSDGALRLSSP